MKKLFTFLKGILLGTAVLIPGFSGGTMAVILGIYEKLIDAVSNFRKDPKKYLPFLIPLFIGTITGILLLSKVLSYALTNHKTAVIFLFVGLMLGGLPYLFKNVNRKSFNIKNFSISLISFLIILSIVLFKSEGKVVSFELMNSFDYFLLFLVGVIASVTLVIPGISGSLVLMIIGYYEALLLVIQNLLHFDNLGTNLLIIAPFGLGVLVGLITIVKLIDYFLKKFHNESYYAIFGIVFASIVVLLLPIKSSHTLLYLVIGLAISYLLGKKQL